jgi:hypothetical protein
VRRGQTWSVEYVPITDHPAPAAFPIFELPAHLTGADYKSGIIVLPSSGVLVDERWQTLLQRLRADSCHFEQPFRPIDFARLIAKVAYGMAIYQCGYDFLDMRYVVPCILGQRDDAGLWVGSTSGSFRNPGKCLHEVLLGRVRQEVRAYVRLFAKVGGPEYVVVLGTLAASVGAPAQITLQRDQ